MMKLYIDIFISFFTIGLIGFGGGYAMIPVIQNEIEANGWMDVARFDDMISISAMAPGPFVANSATMIGYETSALPGAIVACLAVILPSLLLVIIMGRVLVKFEGHYIALSAFYGLRPVIAGIIAFAAYRYALNSGIIGGAGVIEVKGLIIAVISFLLLFKTKIHPLAIITASAIAGILLFK